MNEDWAPTVGHRFSKSWPSKLACRRGARSNRILDLPKIKNPNHLFVESFSLLDFRGAQIRVLKFDYDCWRLNVTSVIPNSDLTTLARKKLFPILVPCGFRFRPRIAVTYLVCPMPDLQSLLATLRDYVSSTDWTARLSDRRCRFYPETVQIRVEHFWLTSKMSHDGTWRASCRITLSIPPFHFESRFHRTRRAKSRRWLWRLVRHFSLGRLRIYSPKVNATKGASGSGGIEAHVQRSRIINDVL